MELFKALFYGTPLMFGMWMDEAEGGEAEGENESESEESQSGSEQSQSGSWRDDILPDDLKGMPLFEKYNSPQDALKAFAEAQKLIGKKGILPPSEGATDEEKAEFVKQVYQALGEEVPEEVDGYEFDEIEDLPEELKDFDATLKDKILTYAKDKHLSKQRANELYNIAQELLVESYNNNIEATDQAIKAAETALRKEWGKAYDTKLANASKLAKQFDEATQSFLKQHEGDPRLIKLLATMAEKVSEDNLKGTPKPMVLTPEAAKEEIIHIKADPNHPFNNPDHPEHSLAVSKMDDLYRQAYPELQETS